MADPKTHDYTVRTWGHDFGIDHVENRGDVLRAHGWGAGIAVGHVLILPVPGMQSTTQYRVERIDYSRDPPDMWFATLRFAPR